MKGTISFAEIMSLANFLKRYEGGFIEKNYQSDYDRETISFLQDGMNIELKMNKTAGENADR